MTFFSSGLSLAWESIGAVTGFVLSLLIFSFILRETVLVRLAQYLLVGVSLGYAVVLVWHSVLLPRLVRPLLADAIFVVPTEAIPGREALWLYWIPLGLGLLLWLAGLDHLRGSATTSWPWLRTVLRLLALIPLGLMAGVGLGAGIAGALQGTLIPQFLRAAYLGWLDDAPLALLSVGILTLVITGGSLLHLYVGERTVNERTYPRPLRWLMGGWMWIGQRALWLAAGVIFARLFASRMTLLIARLSYFLYDLRQSDLWTWLRAVLGGSP